MKKATINWDTFLPAVRQFPHFRQILIQWAVPLEFPRQQLITVHNSSLNSSPRQILVEFLAHLGEAWFALDEPLGLYYMERDGFGWVQLRLDATVMDEIEQMVSVFLSHLIHALLTDWIYAMTQRAEITAEADTEKAASSELESNVVEEKFESHTAGNK